MNQPMMRIPRSQDLDANQFPLVCVGYRRIGRIGL
jgi:hypothetical protein